MPGPDEIVVLDGGLSNALRERGVRLHDDLWTARLLRDDPDAIVAVHETYYRAGADVATTASYQASVGGFVRHGMTLAEARSAIVRSVELARTARDRVLDTRDRDTTDLDTRDPDTTDLDTRDPHTRDPDTADLDTSNPDTGDRDISAVATADPGRDGRSPPTGGGGRRLLVAASVGPYGAVLHDGSEYRGRYGRSPAELRDFHGPRLDLLASAGPDLFAVETIPDADEAAVLVPLLDDLGIPAWFAYSVRGAQTCAGQRLADAYDVVAGARSIIAAGVNCSAPADVAGAIDVAVARTGRPGVAYPNRGGTWDPACGDWTGNDAALSDLVPHWLALGARWVGGCCEVGPADIALLAHQVRTPYDRR